MANGFYMKMMVKSSAIEIAFKTLWASWVHLRGPVIQANGRLTFVDDLWSGGLLCFTTQ